MLGNGGSVHFDEQLIATLTGRSPDERVVREVLQNKLEDERSLSAVLIVVDVVHFKRNFNLVAEVLQTGVALHPRDQHGRHRPIEGYLDRL